MTTANWKELEASHELAYFRGNLAVEFPESYTIDEMKAINEGMAKSTKEVEEAIRNDFSKMPPEFQDHMLPPQSPRGKKCLTFAPQLAVAVARARAEVLHDLSSNVRPVDSHKHHPFRYAGTAEATP